MMTLRRPILGVLLAIAITTAMDASGLSAFSALPLFPLMALFWYLERMPRREVGFARGEGRHYLLALAYPVVVIGLLALLSSASGAMDVSKTNWRKAALNIALLSLSTLLVAILTEEGFFRGWLWASLERAGVRRSRVLLWSSLAFALWHVSVVTLKTDFNPPPAQVPVFLVNAAFLGAIWGLLRWISGSIIVASVSHGVWNGLAYVLFGFGSRVGALGVKKAALFGPEVGILGLALNVVFFGALWRWSGPERSPGNTRSAQALVDNRSEEPT
jgi:membrane protease YdiL (CAAX protease family)